MYLMKEEFKHKQEETLEEASKRYSYGGREGGHRTPFLEGIKWQTERSYSKQDMIAFGEFIHKHILLVHIKGVESLFEQFKYKKDENRQT